MDWIKESFDKYAGKDAVIYRDRRYSYRELLDRISDVASLLGKHRIAPGEVVAFLGDYSFDSIAAFFALADNRNVIVPIVSTGADEISGKLKESYSDAVITFADGIVLERLDKDTPERHVLLNQLRERDHAGLILFSSGSTGKPKAMLHDLDLLMDSYRGKKEKNLNILVFLTFDHIGGIDTLLRAIATGSSVTIPESRDPIHVGGLIEKHQVDVLPASPTFLNLMLIAEVHKQFQMSSLKIIGFGAEPMPQGLLDRLIGLFPHVRFQQKFGTSETNTVRVKSKSDSSLFFRIDDPNITFRIVDGELHLKSRTQIMGYLHDSVPSFKDGWFETGDLVEVSDDGYVKIIGRNKDVINVGGAKVVPNEVESVLLEMPQIDDCIVYGAPNVITGQMVVCEVVLKESANVNEIRKNIRLYCREKLDNYKIPSKIKISDKISFGYRFKKIRRTFVEKTT